MEILSIVCTLVFLFAVESQLSPVNTYDIGSLTKTRSPRKREISPHTNLQQFIEEKLVQQSQALEHIIQIAQKNAEMTEKLVENLSKTAEQPKLPEKVEFTRRSFNDKNGTDLPSDGKTSTWCSVSVLCSKSHGAVCGYDEKFGYGKFEDICHLVRVNCYYKYDFSIVPCKPQL